MYAISDELRESWQALSATITPELEALYGEIEPLKFATSDEILKNPQLLIGQTCGFPLVTRYNTILKPVCVAQFDTDGCQGPEYSSVILVSCDSEINSLEDARGRSAIINGTDSNSGMNVFRAMVTSKREAGKPFFSNTLLSGSHRASLQAVSERKADIASIDCVTFAYLKSFSPELVAKVKVLEYSDFTMGLPFVVSTSREKALTPAYIVDLLNTGLHSLSAQHRERLRINTFSEAAFEDYTPIAEMNNAARRAEHHADRL